MATATFDQPTHHGEAILSRGERYRRKHKTAD
jgi:hypothetical protein